MGRNVRIGRRSRGYVSPDNARKLGYPGTWGSKRHNTGHFLPFIQYYTTGEIVQKLMFHESGSKGSSHNLARATSSRMVEDRSKVL